MVDRKRVESGNWSRLHHRPRGSKIVHSKISLDAGLIYWLAIRTHHRIVEQCPLGDIKWVVSWACEIVSWRNWRGRKKVISLLEVIVGDIHVWSSIIWIV